MSKGAAVAEHDHGYKILFSHTEMVEDLFRDFVQKRKSEREELRRAFVTYLMKYLLPARMPGIELPEVADLQEVQSMLAEHALEWTHQWKQEGLKEGLERARGVLLQALETRFGFLPDEFL